MDSVDDADLAVFFVAGIRGGPWRGQLYVSKYSLNLRSFGYRTHLDEPFVSRSMEPITIALDFLKSSSRGGPRVPRPLLLVKVTAAAAARAASLASRPKFTRYSFLHSRLSKKDIRTPLFGPPFSLAQNVRLDSLGARPILFVACLTLSLPGIPSLCSLRPPFTSPAGSQLPRVFTCTHGTVLSGSALFALKVRVLCRLPALSGSPGQSYLVLCRLADADQLESVVDELLALSRISWKVVDELLALSALKV